MPLEETQGDGWPRRCRGARRGHGTTQEYTHTWGSSWTRDEHEEAENVMKRYQCVGDTRWLQQGQGREVHLFATSVKVRHAFVRHASTKHTPRVVLGEVHGNGSHVVITLLAVSRGGEHYFLLLWKQDFSIIFFFFPPRVIFLNQMSSNFLRNLEAYFFLSFFLHTRFLRHHCRHHGKYRHPHKSFIDSSL